jgi:TRAP-type mannitol/chloroaromatic compound transport system substrate-binding protein
LGEGVFKTSKNAKTIWEDEMNKFTRTAVMGLMLAASPAFAQEVEGPEVNWSFSMWGNPRALSAGMEASADRVEEATGGNFNIKIFYGGQ